MNVGEFRSILGPDLVRWVTNGAKLGEDDQPAEAPLAELCELVLRLHRGGRSASDVLPMYGKHGVKLNEVRKRAGGRLPTINEPHDAVSYLLRSFAIDAYPLLLLHDALRANRRPHGYWIPYFLGDTRDREFRTAVLADESLGQVFRGDDPDDSDVGCQVSTNTDSSYSMQLDRFAGSILACASQLLDLQGERTVEAFIATAVALLETWRSLAATGKATVPAYLGFAGVAFPPGHSRCRLPWGDLRSVDAKDLTRLPLEAWPFRMQDGENPPFLAGLVFETEYPLRATFRDCRDDSIIQERSEYDSLMARSETIALGAVLAADRSVSAMQMWTTIADPTGHDLVTVYSKRTRYPHAPRLMTVEEVAALGEWVRRVDDAKEKDESIGVARRRTFRAANERIDPEDGLIDAVIALENLFGDMGELTFRISSSVAVLLGENAAARRELQASVKNLYTLRSKLVHGVRNLTQKESTDARDEALGYAIECLRVLYRDRRDLLTDKSRSTTLLLGVKP